jgi:HD-like signal output (HDOD) protein
MRPSTESQVALNFCPNLPISGQVNPVNPAESTCAAIAEKLSKLPPFGPAVQNLLRISLDDDSAVRLFEDAFMSDPALTAELLVMANSAAFGGRSRVQTIGMAIRNLGLERVRSLATTSALRSHTQRGPDQQYLASVWAHGVATAVAAEALGELSGFPDLYTLGLTHDLGRLGLFLAGGQAYAVALSKEFLDIEQADQAERNLFGVTHCQAGAVVAAVWGFPDSLAACMGQHHSLPSGAQGGSRGMIVTACQMADSLGFPEVPLSHAPGWPELCPSLERNPQLEPEALWDQITRRIADLRG